MSFSPLTKLVYIPGQERSSSYAPEANYQYKPGAFNTANALGGGANGPAPEPEGADKQPKASGGFLLAWDPVTQKERWRITGPGVGGYDGGGGTLVTGGNLVFHGNAAYDATTGQKVWETDMLDRAVTPVSYMLDGKQYISVIARPGPAARVFTFVLDGKEPAPPAPPPPPATTGRANH